MFRRYTPYVKAVLAAVALCLAARPAPARPKSAGAVFSFTGLSVCYEHDLAVGDSFIELALKAETSEYLLKRAAYPGVSAGLTWNIVISEWLSSEGNALKFFAGLGVAIGYGADFRTADGVFFGLKGRVGGECSFSRNVLISVSIAPVIGSHIATRKDSFSMKYYKNGLIYGIVPEIGIKYRF